MSHALPERAKHEPDRQVPVIGDTAAPISACLMEPKSELTRRWTQFDHNGEADGTHQAPGISYAQMIAPPM